MLFQSAMSGDPGAFSREHFIPVPMMTMWKERYHREYIDYLEKLLRVIRERVID